MKKQIGIAFIILIVCISSVLLTHGNINLINIGKVKTSQAEQTEELVLKYKTTDSIAISWENMQIPETVVKFNVYLNGQLITQTTDKLYVYTSLTNGVAYNLKVDFLDSNDNIILSKSIDSLKPAVVISSFTQDVTLQKDTYYISAYNVPAGITVNVAAGSTLKFNPRSTFSVDGTLNIQGTLDEKVLMTSMDDIGEGCWYSGYAQNITVNNTGTLDIDNATIKCIGTRYSYGSYYSGEYVISNGTLKIKNSNTVDLTYGRTQAGTVEISNSNLNCNMTFGDTSNVDIQNSTFKNITVAYNNPSQQNNINILNNTITDGILYCPNMLSTATIKNNITTGDISPVKMYLDSANSDILNDISGNSISPRYGEIQIVSMPTVSEITFPKRVYSINMYNPAVKVGTTVNIAAGSTLKFVERESFTVNGTLKLQGTTEEKILMTSMNDTGSGCSYSEYCKNIIVSETGTLDIDNTTIKCIGTGYSYGSYYPGEYIISNGTLKIKNSETVNLTYARTQAGTVEISNSNLNCNMTFGDTPNVDIQNSTFKNITVVYGNPSQQNNINILNNTINDGILYYPNVLSTATIKNNITTGDTSPVKMYLDTANSNILNDISGNSISPRYGEIQIVSMPTVSEITFPKRVYSINMYNPAVKAGTTVNVAAGSTLKFVERESFTVNGTLKLQGTAEEKILMTSMNDIGFGCSYSEYCKNIIVSETGTFDIDNTIMECIGTSYSYGSYYPGEYVISNGTLKINNSETVNLTYGRTQAGTVEISNSNLNCNMVFANAPSMNVQNSTFKNVIVAYADPSLQNNINMVNNTITDGILYYPNILSIATIKNNITTGDASSVKIYLDSANSNILNDISGNSISPRYGEIQIVSMPTVSEITFPKRVYSINMYNPAVNAGTTVNVAAGSTLKLVERESFTVNGTLKLLGTAEEKVLMTAMNDTGSGCGYSEYSKNITVSNTGTLDIDNTTMKCIGTSYSYGSYYPGEYVISNGTLKLKNAETQNLLYATIQSGNVEVNSSNLNGYMFINNASNIDIQNSSFKNIGMSYTNSGIQNNTNIINNTITDGMTYMPNMLSTATIKDNVSTSTIPLQLSCTNAEPNILKNISNNRNTSNPYYDGIYINGTINNLKLVNKNEYIFGTVTVPSDKLLEIEQGTKCKFELYGVIEVNGKLFLNGTIENNIILTNRTEDTSSYGKGIQINSTGYAVINNMEMRYNGCNINYYTRLPAIQNNGQMDLINSSISNTQSGQAIIYSTNVAEQTLKCNYFGGSVSSNIAIDGTYNFWGANNGPTRYNTESNTYEGSGSFVDANTNWNPFNENFAKTEFTLDSVINDSLKNEKVHFGEAGVNGYTGNYSKTYDDLNVVIPNIDLKFTRTYNSKNASSDILGRGWTFGFSSKVEVNPLNTNDIYVYLPNGSVNTFTKQSDGTFVTNDARNTLTIENGNYALTTKEQTKYLFNSNRYLNKIVDKYGNETNINIDTSGKITNITDYTGRVYTIEYTNNKVSKIIDPMNRNITYSYNAQGLLAEVIRLNGKSTYYEYDDSGYMTFIKEKNSSDQIITVNSMTYVKDSTNSSRILTEKDEYGKIDTYTYNQDERSTTIVDQNNRVTKTYYDTKGYTIKVVNPSNLQTVIVYDTVDSVNKFGDVKSRTEVTGQTTTYDRDSSGNVIKQTNADNSYKIYEYNSKNSLTKEIDELGNITQYVYDADGVTLTKKILPNNAEVSLEYEQTGIKGLVSKKTDELGKSTTYVYDNYGYPIKTTNALGNSETYTYNNIGWLLSKTTCEGFATTYEYDNIGNNTKTIQNSRSTTINEYNYKNNPTKIIDANNNSITYDYDDAQNVIKKTDQEGNVTSYEYDIYGNMIKETTSNGAVYAYDYDNINRKIKTSIMQNEAATVLEEKSYSYNNGNKTTTTKQYSNATDYTTNVQVANYLDKVISDKTENAEKTNTYLTNGLLSLEQNEVGKRIYYYYNSLGKVSTKYEEIDNNKYKRTNYEYDLAGNAIKEETSQEKVALEQIPTSYITTNYTYDDIVNVISKTTSSNEETKLTYDKDKNVVKQEVKIEDGKYKTTEYTYNYAAKVTSKKEYIEKGSLVSNSIDDTSLTTLITSYEYDNMMNLTKETNPEGIVINRYYDKLNRETKNEIIKDDKTITETTSYLYDSKDKVVSKTDGNGNTTTYEYDIFGNAIKEIKPNNIVTTYEYDLFGNPTKEILPNHVENTQNNTTYTYDKYGNVKTKTKNYLEYSILKQITTTYEYDLSGNVTKETTSNVSQSSTYNKSGKTITKVDGNNNTTAYEYDANLNVIKETNPKSSVTNYFYDERNNLIKKDIDNVIQEETTYDLVNNKLIEKDELGLVISNTYDLNSNLVKQINSETGYTVINQYTLSGKVAKAVDNYDKELLYKYDMLNNVIEETEQKSDGSQAITTKTKYDNLSNKIEETDGNNNVTKYEYDANNNLVKETNPKLQVTTYTYDKNGNKLTETDYLNNTLTNTYDNLDRVIEKLDQYGKRIEKLVYDNLGRQIQSIDANNNRIEYTFDNNNNILTKKDQEGHIETYEYDKLNNKAKYIDKNNNITTYEYNNKNKLTKVTNALNESTTYTYDNKGNMLTQKDAANNTITFVFDKNSNEIKKIDQLGKEDNKTYYPNGKQETFTTNNGDIFTYTYDIHGRLINENIGQEDTTYEYDNNDNQTKIGNVSKTYDSLNRVLTKTENNQTVTYTYDDTNKTVTVTDPKGNVTTEQYDKASRLLKVTNDNKVTEYVYNDDGSVQKQINPTTTSVYEYYPDKKLKRLTTKDGNDILIEESYYEYDNNDNITKENNKTYTYDALNRIKTNDGTEYEYDTSGNILTKSVLDGTTLKVTGYSYNDKNQLLATSTLENASVVSESTYTYDDNGNQLTETTDGLTTSNTYNARNELTEVNNGQTVAEYVYNAEGKRVQKIANNVTTNFVYDGDNIILELDDQNNQVATNTYGLKLLKRTTDKDGYYLYNGHGDVTKILDTNNTQLNSYVYDAFGKILQENETFNNPFKYAGYYYDKETKTYYLQARYYNPETQRFISEDTYRGNIDDLLSLNLYTYVKNNPLIYVDPSGHFWEEIEAVSDYIGKRNGAFIQAGVEFVLDSVKGTAGIVWNLTETLEHEIKFVGNEVQYNFGLMGREQYLNNREQHLKVISKHMDMYKQMPGNMVTGIIDNFKTTLNPENFLNYLNPNTSYEELKNYSKSAIQTGLTIYGGVKIVKSAFNKLNQVYNGTQVDKVSSVKTNTFDDVSNSIAKDGKLPDNYITKAEATKLGWNAKAGNLADVAPGKSIGGDIFKNKGNPLPSAPERIWYEADVNYTSGYRGNNRILYSNDGLIYKSIDHYKTFIKIK